MKRTIVVNFTGGPGCGKSTMATHLFAELKWSGINCEYVSEYCKDKVWEESYKVLDSQIYVFGKQYHKLKRLEDKVDVIITDAPLIHSIIYNKEDGETFNELVLQTFNSFNNINYYIERKKPYNPKGRTQTLEQSKGIDGDIKTILDNHNVEYTIVPGVREQVIELRDEILNILKK